MNPRVFVDSPLEVGGCITISGEDGHHYARVLRIEPEEWLPIASQGQGYLAQVKAVDSKKGEVQLTVVDALPNHEPSTKLYLVQGLAKGDKLDTILQHNTEVGVSGFLLYQSKRSVVRIEEKKRVGKLERWRKILKEASSQSQRDRIPLLDYADNFRQAETWCAKLQPNAVLFLDEAEDGTTLKSLLDKHELSTTPGTIIVAVGPEGGWDEDERRSWQTGLRAVPTSLGRRILRTETAGLAAAAAILYHYEDLGG